MCCNRPRTTVGKGERRWVAAAGAAPPGSLPAPPFAASAPAASVFEYAGETALTVVSPITRKVYRFEKTGTRVTVDVRDRSLVAFMPNVVRVR